MQQVFIQQTKINLQQQKRNESDTNTLNKSTKKRQAQHDMMRACRLLYY